jgi:hypothetical protein
LSFFAKPGGATPTPTPKSDVGAAPQKITPTAKASQGSPSQTPAKSTAVSDEKTKTKLSLIDEKAHKASPAAAKSLPKVNATPAATKSEPKPPAAGAPGPEIIGRTVKVFWPDDAKWFTGTVQQFDAECGEHMILYEDGDEECVCLAKEKVQAHPSSPHLIAHARGSNFAAYPVAAIRT